MTILSIFLILYGLFCMITGIFKFSAIWRMGKIQIFVKILGNAGTMIFFFIWGGVALGIGIWLLVR